MNSNDDENDTSFGYVVEGGRYLRRSHGNTVPEPSRRLNNEQLRRIAAANPPPQSWYEQEEERPF